MYLTFSLFELKTKFLIFIIQKISILLSTSSILIENEWRNIVKENCSIFLIISLFFYDNRLKIPCCNISSTWKIDKDVDTCVIKDGQISDTKQNSQNCTQIMQWINLSRLNNLNIFYIKIAKSDSRFIKISEIVSLCDVITSNRKLND